MRLLARLTWMLFLLVALAAGEANAAQLTIKWSYAHRTETRFRVERAPGGPVAWVTWTPVALVSYNVKRFTDTGLATNTQYQYRVRAENNTSVSPYSNIVSKVTAR